jgi:hypothetical protein
MRIEVLVPGIKKERGKLPPPTTLGALELAVPLLDNRGRAKRRSLAIAR